MHVAFAVGYSVMPTEASDEQTNDAWLILLFSGWYVVLLTVEASEGKNSCREDGYECPDIAVYCIQ
jgi:hypothetical protein